MEDTNKEINVLYAIINNIPVEYHSADLRNYFSQFIEEEGFECFHFRHRPEQVQAENEQNVTANQSSVTKSKRTTCCVIKLTTKQFQKFLKMYQRKHWVDKNGDVMRQMCFISRIRQPGRADDPKFLTRAEQKQIPEERETFTLSDLQRLPELSPPDIMPNGNVGTPTMHFMDLIKQCRLPPKVIKKLGLTFPKTKTNKKYGSVPFNYGGDVVSLEDSDDSFQVCTAAGHEIPQFSGNSFKNTRISADKDAGGAELDHEQNNTGSSDQQNSKMKRVYIDKEMRRRMNLRIEEKMIGDEPGSDEDNDSCEEWERHEALYDDVSNQERNKERLFEEEIELKWEKGGSGLVFYTDAQYWQAQEGDFDEQTADDWDVDMSAYYEDGAGDKDIRDFLTIRQEKRRRDGIEATDRFTAGIAKRLKSKNSSKKTKTDYKIGEFEEHTRGFGRKIMEDQGWTDGKGLGSSVQGITDALDNDGQNPRDRKGFGYHGEKLNRYHNKPAQRKVIISTIFDDPKQTDPHEPLNRRHEPYTLKYRDEIQFSKAKDT